LFFPYFPYSTIYRFLPGSACINIDILGTNIPVTAQYQQQQQHP